MSAIVHEKISDAPALPPAVALDGVLHHASPAEVIAAALKIVGRERLALVSSFGTESAALLKVMAEAKRQLESMGRDLAFLSIDVVDSTKMKIGEDKTFIEHDFHEYKNLVDGKLRSNGSLKAAWTPDGVMACFPTIDAALKAAKDVIGGLDAFNASSAAYGLQIGQYWWLFGMALVSVAFAYLYFVFRGKVGSQKRKHY